MVFGDAPDSIDSTRKNEEKAIGDFGDQVLEEIEVLVSKLGNDGSDAEIIAEISEKKDSFSVAIEDTLQRMRERTDLETAIVYDGHTL
jgi:hypothetical protein